MIRLYHRLNKKPVLPTSIQSKSPIGIRTRKARETNRSIWASLMQRLGKLFHQNDGPERLSEL